MTELPASTVLARASAAARRVRPDAVVADLGRLPGGVSSLTYAATLAAGGSTREIVVKVAPAGLPAVRNRDVLRQARIMRPLAAAGGIPIPEVLFEDDGDPPLFGMERVPGDCYEPGTDIIADPPSPPVVAERMAAAAAALARMQALTPAGLGVGPEEEVTTPAGELARWERLLETVGPDLAAGHQRLRDRLAERIPQMIGPVVLHGDYRLGNMLFVGPDLSAIIDWEIWSVGDPRHDLSWLLLHCAPPHRFETERPAGDEAAASGLPAPRELLARYVDVRGAAGDLTADLDWFLALNHYKVVSTVAVLSKRNRRQRDPDPRMLVAESSLTAVLDAAHQVLDDHPLSA